MTMEKDVAKAANSVHVDGDDIRLVNNAFAYCFKEARLSISRGSDFEQNKYVGQVFIIMRALASKDGVSLSHFDKIDERQSEIGNTSLIYLLINNLDVAGNKGKIKGQLLLERILDFVKHLKRLLINYDFFYSSKLVTYRIIVIQH